MWSLYDQEAVFGSYKTLHRYYRDLMAQIDSIISILTKKIISLSSEDGLPEIFPADKSPHLKLKILFYQLDRLLELLHMKNRTSPILEDEKYAFLHEFLFRKGKTILLKSRDFP